MSFIEPFESQALLSQYSCSDDFYSKLEPVTRSNESAEQNSYFTHMAPFSPSSANKISVFRSFFVADPASFHRISNQNNLSH